ncbi:MAG: hypothetical protein MUQ10_11045, partial [Anaerolineae bacterium]|nr:hypothetical protein [Anaerolineae bacterium]
VTTSGNGFITGTFIFSMTAAGSHTVLETNPPGYRSTTPDHVYVSVDVGDSRFVEFGDTLNPAVASLYGTVFDDLNGDGLNDLDEPGLPGVVITMTVGTGVVTETTKLYGQYSYGFFVEEAGYHTVTEHDPALPGYRSTTPDEITLLIALTYSYEVDFGDTTAGTFSTIMGTVFDDWSGDGVQDAAETGIPHVLVSLSSGVTTTTDLVGRYTFFVTETGYVHVVETDPAGYHSTTPNDVTVNIASLDSNYIINFGDNDAPFLTSIFGTVFDDSNVNTVRDLTETGISDVTVALSGRVNGLPDDYLTNEWGQYTFLIEHTGPYTITETDLAGYGSTNAIPGSLAVVKLGNNTLLATVSTLGGDLGDNLFGDALASSCICDPDECENDDSAIQGVALTAGTVQVRNFCDDATDWITLTAEAGGIYTITTSSWGQRADTFLTLFDVDGVTVLTANDDFEDAADYSSRIVWVAPADGVYYLLVENRAGLWGCFTTYDIWLEVSIPPVYKVYLPLVLQEAGEATSASAGAGGDEPGGVIVHACPDSYEVDDTWQQAGPIAIGTVQTHSFDSDTTIFAADKDFVFFDISNGETVTFTVGTITNTTTLLELYDSIGTALNVTGTTELVWSANESGRYFLSVSPLTTAFGCASEVGYTLSADLPPWTFIYLPLVLSSPES